MALLSALVGLAMPAERQRDDILRAILDGRPRYDGGVAVPTLGQLRERLLHPETGQRGPTSDADRPLERMVRESVAAGLEPLRLFLREHRKVADKRAHPNVRLVESFERLSASRKVVLVAAGRSAGAATPTSRSTVAGTHTVQAGETLAAVARRFAVTGGWQALHAANREVIGPDPGRLRPGMVLKIPTP